MPKIVEFNELGGPEVLNLHDVALVEPGPGEVRLKVEAFGLNRAEVLYRQGLYLDRPKLPSRIGYEAAGIVDAIGPEVEGIQVGDRVSTIPGFSMTKYGVYGESAIVPANVVATYPESLSTIEGAAVWMQYMTAYGALVTIGGLGAGDTVLITAASSSVGLAAIQIAKSLGATAIATTRGFSKKEALLGAGADYVIVTSEESLARKTLKLTNGKGARIIFDPVAGGFLDKLAKAAAVGGIIIEYGWLSMEPASLPLSEAIAKGLSIRGYTLFEISGDPERLLKGKQFVYDGLESGVFKPIIAKTFKLEEIVEAHRYMESNAQVGKIVVTV